MPEMFGTHHTKMMILLRHDDTAQIIIHTANMIEQDWRNMTQAVWRSPRLPRRSGSSAGPAVGKPSLESGSGEKFKLDFLNYLRAYDVRRVTCAPVIETLVAYDFSAIKGALIGSVPGRHSVRDDAPARWGWAALRDTLKTVPVHPGEEGSEIVAQISSIATLGPTDSWLQKTLFKALKSGPAGVGVNDAPDLKIVFPTPDEIRASLDGYQAGASIHTKTGSSQQAKQLQYMRPMLCHWGNDYPGGASEWLGAPSLIHTRASLPD